MWGLLICALWICSPHHFIPFVPLSTSPFIFIWMLGSIKVISKMCFTVISGGNVAKWVILNWYFVQCPHIHNPANLTWHPSADHLLPHFFFFFYYSRMVHPATMTSLSRLDIRSIAGQMTATQSYAPTPHSTVLSCYVCTSNIRPKSPLKATKANCFILEFSQTINSFAVKLQIFMLNIFATWL